MQQEESGGGAETDVPMQVYKHNNAFTSFTDLLNVMYIFLYCFFELVSSLPYFKFFWLCRVLVKLMTCLSKISFRFII